MPMICPTITRYMESLNNLQGLLRTLGEVEVVRDVYGEPVFRVGNFAVIFKIIYQGKPYALKCYTREPNQDPQLHEFLSQVHPPYFKTCLWLPDEIYVYDEYEQGAYFPVMLMEWIEGETLGRVVARLTQKRDRVGLVDLAGKFNQMALWLLSQEFAHGDLKHDNILVTHTGELILIDYDWIFLPAFAGRRCNLIGSPAYQHPARDENFYNKRIDDYPLAVIALSLHALCEFPELYDRYNDKENLIFNALELVTESSPLLNQLQEHWQQEGESALFTLSRMVTSQTPALSGLTCVFEQLEGASRSILTEFSVQEPQCRTENTSYLCAFEIVDPGDHTCAIIRQQGAYGYANLHTGKVLLEPIYESATLFDHGLAAVRLGGKLRFINPQGKCVIDCARYDAADPFREGLSRVRSGGLYGFINLEGREVIPAQYPFATPFREGLSIVRIEDKYGYINCYGELEIAAVYDFAGLFRSGAASVEVANQTFRIDKSGQKMFEHCKTE